MFLNNFDLSQKRNNICFFYNYFQIKKLKVAKKSNIMKRLLLMLALLIGFNYLNAQISGCTDVKANNYNISAIQNDGSCTYDPAIIDPVASWNLPENIIETSGLIIWEDKIWTHNDDSDNNIYSFETNSINSNQAFPITGTINTDWEEISQDSNYIYIGDFGNNSNGNRSDLHILRIDKKSVLANFPIVDTIQYSYSLQTNLNPAGPNNTDFDCEAFVVSSDSIYLFTKEWISNKSSIYSLPKIPGEYVAKFQGSYDVQGLITGSTYIESKNLIVLSGYSSLVQPFIFLLYDFEDHNFFGGNKRKVSLNLPFHLVDAITTEDGLIYYASNEKLSEIIITNQKLHKIDLSEYLSEYITSSKRKLTNSVEEIEVFPIPSNGILTVKTNMDSAEKQFSLLDMSGKVVSKGHFTTKETQINIKHLNSGSYILILNSSNKFITKRIIKN
jgi:hypothetical protein